MAINLFLQAISIRLLLVLSLFYHSTTISANATWGNTDQRYSFHLTSIAPQKHLQLKAWRGETVNAQLVVQNLTSETGIYSIIVKSLKGTKQQKINTKNITAGWVDEVITDTFSHCGRHEIERYGRFLKADRIVNESTFYLPSQEQRGVWLSISVPQNTEAGDYTGKVVILRNKKVVNQLLLQLHINNRKLPAASQWNFHLDFWQNPYAIARWHKVSPWSEAHFEAMRPYMELLAKSGQKVVTATLINKPWDGQTYDPFGSMIEWKKEKDGTWDYDFSIFDRWVTFMQQCGIDQEITCFSMIPWKLSFQYFDIASDKYKEWKGTPGDSLYSTRWGHFLSAFATHLSQRGWLHKTTIAMDERSLGAMQKAIALIQRSAPGLRISMAGNYHPEIEADLYDYCIDEQSPAQPTPQVIARRQQEGKITTYYTCCSSKYPNTFTFSAPAEASLIPWYALKKGVNGYLRWAYNSWPADPEKDSRFTAWSAGDTYIIYPKAYASIRWAKLTEGIQQYEKFRHLLSEAKEKRNTTLVQRLQQLLETIDPFQPETATAAQESLNLLSFQ